MLTARTTRIRLFIHQRPGEPQQALIVDMSRFGEMFGPLLGVREVDVTWQPIATGEAAEKLATLEAELEAERAQFRNREEAVLVEINQLKTALAYHS